MPRGAKRDKELTAARHYLDPRSFMSTLGEQRLFGADVGVLREAVFARDKFQCVECGSRQKLQMHHVKSRGKGGEDSLENCRTLCGKHHYEKHVQVQWTRKVTP